MSADKVGGKKNKKKKQIKEKEKRKKEKGGEESITEFFFYAQNRVKFERGKRKKRIRPIYVSLPWWYYRFFTTYIHIYIYI